MLINRANIRKPIGLLNSDEGMSKNIAFPQNSRRATTGEVPSLISPNGSIVIFSLAGCSACQDLYSPLMQYSLENPHIPIFIKLFADNEKAFLEIISKYDLNLPVLPFSTEEIPMYQTRLFPFGYALNGEGIIVAKGSVYGNEQLKLLTQHLQNENRELAKAM
ncbi:MAG: hypothetical protein JWM44_2323 [Bacilli bacterium]|nr:hypothetical protein [Bacilli bacterium]